MPLGPQCPLPLAQYHLHPLRRTPGCLIVIQCYTYSKLYFKCIITWTNHLMILLLHLCHHLCSQGTFHRQHGEGGMAVEGGPLRVSPAPVQRLQAGGLQPTAQEDLHRSAPPESQAADISPRPAASDPPGKGTAALQAVAAPRFLRPRAGSMASSPAGPARGRGVLPYHPRPFPPRARGASVAKAPEPVAALAPSVQPGRGRGR